MPRHVAGKTLAFALMGGRNRSALAGTPSIDVDESFAGSYIRHRLGEVLGDRQTGSVQPGKPLAKLRLGAPWRDRVVARVPERG